ncbi:MAG: hypothetical protein MJZ51_03580 [Bacteroidales bacterium]|nr:hypothetical protein [Bacteroidales bacterium]
MDKRIGTITVLVEDRSMAAEVNVAISNHADIVLCRQGLPFHDRAVGVISLIVEGEPDRINALTGSLGRIQRVQAKSVLTKI